MANPFIVPLNAIRAIEIVARRGSLSAAADELGVTAGAVSQHLRRAEERLGIVLFERHPKGLVPTEALRAILPQLSSGFNGIEEAMKALKGGSEHVLTLTVASVFAARWLIWRVNKFSSAHPDIELRMVVSPVLMDLTRLDIDCGIRFGDGVWPGVKAEHIGGNVVSPVCAPALAAKLKRPEDLAHVPVIRDQSTMLSWEGWFEAAGMAALRLEGPEYYDATLAFDAAIAEQGVLLAVDLMSEGAVRDGKLVRPFDTHLTTKRGYWLAVPEGRREPKKVTAFRQWLRSELT
jgi:DNA-binding transcriptional LysR family regulator